MMVRIIQLLKTIENNATHLNILSIKPEKDVNCCSNDTNNGNSKDTEIKATNINSLNIKPEIDANSWDGCTENTDSKDNESNAVNYKTLSIKLEVDSIDVNAVKDESSLPGISTGLK